MDQKQPAWPTMQKQGANSESSRTPMLSETKQIPRDSIIIELNDFLTFFVD